MTFCLLHRATFDPISISHCLNIQDPHSNVPHIPHSPPNAATLSPTCPIRPLALETAICAVSVVHDATAFAIASEKGIVSLSTSTSNHPASTTTISIPPHIHPVAPAWCQFATSVVLFHFHNPTTSLLQRYLAVGYQSGAIAIFNVQTTSLLAVTVPQKDQPVVHLHTYRSSRVPTAKPQQNSTFDFDLFAVIGDAGVVSYLPAQHLANLLDSPSLSFDSAGAHWVVWTLSAQDAVRDAAICGPDPSSICNFDDYPPFASLRVVSVGLNPPFSAYAVSFQPTFSVRAAAKQAASTVFSAARGFMFSRLAPSTEYPSPTVTESGVSALKGAGNHRASWSDDPFSLFGGIKFDDVRDTARKSFHAVLDRGNHLRHATRSASVGADTLPSARYDVSEAVVPSKVVVEDGKDNVNAGAPEILPRMESGGTSKPGRGSRHSQGGSASYASKLQPNSRMVERMAVAPFPYTLLATCDTLGRIIVQDSRDLCVLRILKGYRDAQVAWLAGQVPFLVVYAPRLNVLEVHNFHERKRSHAFRVMPGSVLSQTFSHQVFCTYPDGSIYEIMLIEDRKDKNEVL